MDINSSQGPNIFLTEKIDTGKQSGSKIIFSPDNKNIVVSFPDTASLYQKGSSVSTIAIVLGAVIGSVVVGSITAIALATTMAPGAASAAAAGGGESANGIIGIQQIRGELYQVHGDDGVEYDFKGLLWYFWYFCSFEPLPTNFIDFELQYTFFSVFYWK